MASLLIDYSVQPRLAESRPAYTLASHVLDERHDEAGLTHEPVAANLRSRKGRAKPFQLERSVTGDQSGQHFSETQANVCEGIDAPTSTRSMVSPPSS